MADTEQTQQKAPEFRMPSQISASELAAAFEKEGLIEATPEQPKAEVAPATPAAKAEEPPATKTEETPALVKLAQQQAAFRKEVEQVKPYLEAMKVLSPQEIQRIAQARASGNPVAALAALGFTHAEYNERLVGMTPSAKKSEEEKPTGNAQYDALQKEIQALKAEREAERNQVARTQMLSKMTDVLKDNPKFNHINKLGDYEGVERVLIQYHAAHGGLPGSTIEESVQLAAEIHEAQLKKEAERWRQVLTPVTTSAQATAQKASESLPSPGTAQTRTLTNANTTAPAAGRTVPKTREEKIAALLEGREVDDLLSE